MNAVEIENLGHSYGARRALDEVSFAVGEGEIFGLLGPNGGGKTTLFRILSTLLEPSSGNLSVFGASPLTDPDAVRLSIGVVFQSFSLDKILTVEENLLHQGRLYGLSGKPLRDAIENRLNRVGMGDRRGDRVGGLSGGMQRRVEVAKGLLHNPRLLILDEPSTGLDPGARIDLWRHLGGLRDGDETTTILVTTHLMEEAERCDRLGILSEGRLVALGSPEELKSQVGEEVLTIRSGQPIETIRILKDRFGFEATEFNGAIRVEAGKDGASKLSSIAEALGALAESISIGKPTLEDVFIRRTGHTFWEEEGGAE